jgi:hypothetical protein
MMRAKWIRAIRHACMFLPDAAQMASDTFASALLNTKLFQIVLLKIKT